MAIGINNSSSTQRDHALGRVVEWPGGLLALWFVAAALFLGRALAGRFQQPLSSLGLIAVAALILMISMAIRSLLRGGFAKSMVPPSTASDWFVQFVPTLAVILLAAGFTVAGAYVTGLVFLWLIVTAEVLFGAAGPWTLPRIHRWLGIDSADRVAVVLDQPRHVLLQQTQREPLVEEINSDDEMENEEVPWLWQEATGLQELRYMTLPDVGLCIAGSQRVLLSAEQQTTVVHTVFHPPFTTVPAITIERHEPEGMTIKAAQLLPNGIRWEIRADQATEQPREVKWVFIASAR